MPRRWAAASALRIWPWRSIARRRVRDDVGVAERRHHARLVEEPRERVGSLGAREVGVQELDRDVALELDVAREVDHAGRPAPELADQAIARAGLDPGDVAGGDRLAGDRGGAAGEHAQALDPHADVGVVDIVAEHRLVVPQRALVIAVLAGVLGQEVVRAQHVARVTGEPVEVGQRGVELAALLVALDEGRAQRRGRGRRDLGYRQELLHPLDRQPLVARAPQPVEVVHDLGRADLVASLAVGEIGDQLGEERLVGAAQVQRLDRGGRELGRRGPAAEQPAPQRCLVLSQCRSLRRPRAGGPAGSPGCEPRRAARR